jgi:hypothetical protein
MPAVNRSVVASWVSGDNEIQVTSTPVTLTAIEIQGNPIQSQVAYLRIWNVANPTPGTTEPDMVIPVFRPNVQDGDVRSKVICASGKRFDTALSYGLYTTPHSGSTAPTINQGPMSVQIFYIPS